MKKVLVKLKIITQEYQPAQVDEQGNVISPEVPEQSRAGEQIDESGIMSDAEVEFFISQRPQYICEVVDASAEVAAKTAAEDKRKAAKDRIQSFDKSKLTTIAACREVIADLVELQREAP